MRLSEIAYFELCEPNLCKANKETKTVPETFIIRKGASTSFLQPENSTQSIIVSNNQIARLDDHNEKTEPPVEETISQSEPHVPNTDVGPSPQDEAVAATSAAEKRQPESSGSSRTLTGNRN